MSKLDVRELIVLPFALRPESDRHRSILISEAAYFASPNAVTVSPPGLRGRGRLARSIGYVNGHLRVAVACWKLRRSTFIVVREFVTPAMLIVWPILWPLRRRVILATHHNVQQTERSAIYKYALGCLTWLGGRLLVFEHPAMVLDRRFGKNPISVPFPLRAQMRPAGDRGRNGCTVGLIGSFRRDKGDVIADVRRLLGSDDLFDISIVIGAPRVDLAEIPSDVLKDPRVWVRDTTSLSVLEEVLGTVDVVVLNYSSEGYRLRPSAMVAEAIRHGAIPVVPCFPVLSHQVSWPTAVGVTYDRERGDLCDALKTAIAMVDEPAIEVRRHEYLEARSAVRVGMHMRSSLGML